MIDRTFGLGLLMLATMGGIQGVAAQNAPRTSAQDGVYTAEQATRGEATYTEHCASCHGPTLEGRGQMPPLTGSEFTTTWNEMTVWDLFDKIQVTMPADHPGQLTPDQNAAIVAYIFKVNGAPAGPQALPTVEASLAAIRIGALPK
jgi:mono/diheme cytochrome c family protein